MGLSVKKKEELSGRKVVAGERMYMTEDKNRVVSGDSPEAAYLYSGAGTEIPVEDVDKFGLRKEGEAYFLPDAERQVADALNGTQDPAALVPVEQFKAVTQHLVEVLKDADEKGERIAELVASEDAARITIGQKDAEIAGLKADGEAASQELAQRDADNAKLAKENETLKEKNAKLAADLDKVKANLAKAKTKPEENEAVQNAPENKAVTNAPETK